MEVTSSLADATPGKLSVYQNGGIDIVRKWRADETPQQRLDRSAYEKMKRPTIGTIISLAH